MEYSARACFRVEPELAILRFGQRTTDRQTEAQSVVLGTEKRLKDPAGGFVIDSRATITHRYVRHVTTSHRSHSNRKGRRGNARFLHGINAVLDEIEQHFF